MQNVLRWEAEEGARFVPTQVDLGAASNVLDRWIAAASRSLTAFVKEEMEAYRCGGFGGGRGCCCKGSCANACVRLLVCGYRVSSIVRRRRSSGRWEAFSVALKGVKGI